ncbi:MAG: SPOR domain-containing protein [Magnetococcales bacterium]|nr:SPOR domain-containing protein [Magnetococcales bacterium]
MMTVRRYPVFDSVFHPKILIASLGCCLFMTGCMGHLQRVPVHYAEPAQKLDQEPANNPVVQAHEAKQVPTAPPPMAPPAPMAPSGGEAISPQTTLAPSASSEKNDTAPPPMLEAEVLEETKVAQEVGIKPSQIKESPGTQEDSVEKKPGLLDRAGQFFQTMFSSPTQSENPKEDDGVKPQSPSDAAPTLESSSLPEGGLPLDTGSASSFEETAPWQSGDATHKGQGYYVEVEGLSDGGNAEQTTKRLKALNVPFLQQQVRVDGALVHHIYVGPFADRKDAQTMATDLQKRKVKVGVITNQLK